MGSPGILSPKAGARIVRFSDRPSRLLFWKKRTPRESLRRAPNTCFSSIVEILLACKCQKGALSLSWIAGAGRGNLGPTKKGFLLASVGAM